MFCGANTLHKRFVSLGYLTLENFMRDMRFGLGLLKMDIARVWIERLNHENLIDSIVNPSLMLDTLVLPSEGFAKIRSPRSFKKPQ